jgi:hypothetical protein
MSQLTATDQFYLAPVIAPCPTATHSFYVAAGWRRPDRRTVRLRCRRCGICLEQQQRLTPA